MKRIANPDVIVKACDEIDADALDRARQIILQEYPFEPLVKTARQYSSLQKTKIFFRDGFVDRYSGERLIFPAVLRLLSRLMPEEFPFHRNWKTSECHMAFWQLYPTIDHIVPVSRGGLDAEPNWVCTSQLRNSAKSNWLLDEIGWSMHEPGDIKLWDGMIYWYVRYLNSHQALLEDNYLYSWYRAANQVIGL